MKAERNYELPMFYMVEDNEYDNTCDSCGGLAGQTHSAGPWYCLKTGGELVEVDPCGFYHPIDLVY